MNASPQVSSLYGPGAFVGWICTMGSVLVSWTCNRRNESQDSIGNDLIATLTLPSVAAIQYQYELWHTRKDGIPPAKEILDATSCIVLWYLAFGPWLFGISAITGKMKRSVCTATIFALCLSVSSIKYVRRALQVEFPAADSYNVCNIAMSSYNLLRYAGLLQIRGKNIRLETYRNKTFGALRLFSKIMPWVFAFVIYTPEVIHLVLSEDRDPTLVLLELFSVPRTGYSVMELDQAVALSAGASTLAYSIYEAFTSRTLSPWEEYQIWRASCETLLKEGILEEDETALWNEELLVMAHQVKLVLDAPSSTEILLKMVQIKEEREELAEISKEKQVVEQLRDSGFL
ncbi:hypothetical protein P153DRAFT_432419 [Dothidotthia symphoricarpi CBS 119687]|uniref:Uncharacterized protein n=1 Tax=Dothidotthia symphoricarpi CBS 119687 TaxID=1392245 RepID=A0A6A6AA89_9PLEO|nr:uncharacterized protein P153DRAFT_432419 [Dothidotthia symphoricarpi CBS 119687]KAF2128004.1 hypothetical protein P153DRAFT_432419 [Dothidotthia symphoricarpi CBS 119687]